MRVRRTKTDRSLKILSILFGMALLLFGAVPLLYAANSQVANRYDLVQDPTPSTNTKHTFGFTMHNLSIPIGSISFTYCSNSPIVGDSCTVPTGLDVSSAQLDAQQGETGFSVSPLTNGNTIILTRPALLPTESPAQYVFSHIINPSATGSYYVRIQTFTSTDATGAYVEYGGVVFAITSKFSVSAEVPPYMLFCAASVISAPDCSATFTYLINFGDFSSNSPNTGSSQFQIATNAPSGYSISVSGTTLTSGTNVIPAIVPASPSAPGTSQFGFNLRANTNPALGSDPSGYPSGVIAAEYSQPNKFRYQDGDTLVTSATTSDFEKFTASYVVNIDKTQAAGIYATTLTFIALANF